MKKVISLLLALLLCLGLCACAGTATEEPAADDAAADDAAASEESANAEMPSADDAAAADGETKSVDLMFVNNTLTNALVQIAQEHYKPEGVTVNIQVLPEDDMREKFTTEASTGGATYDMYYIGPYETSMWASYGWIENLQPFMDAMTDDEKAAWAFEDIFALQADALKYEGNQYAIPFYGEASFLMYNKEMFDMAGVAYPEHVTFADMLTIAESLEGKIGDARPWVCRAQAGWGNSGAVVFTSLQAFGSTYYDMDWNVTFDSAETREALQWYHDIVVDHGPTDPTAYSYNESIGLFNQAGAAMVYDATSLATSVEGADSLVAGKVGYATVEGANWIWNWAMAINPYSDVKEEVFDFIVWATSPEYVKLSLEVDATGAATPSGVRASTYELPEYASVPYVQGTLAAFEGANFNRDNEPYNGGQYITMPEWTSIGDEITQQVAEFVTGASDLESIVAYSADYLDGVAVDGGYRA